MKGKSRIKVLVAGHDLKFWDPIQRQLEDSDSFEFRQDVWEGHETHNLEQSRSLLRWADVVMCEWVLGNAVWYSRNLRRGQRLVARLHLQERDTEHLDHVDYSKVDMICFVGEHIRHEVIQKRGMPEHKTRVIPNFVDFDRYNLDKRPGAQFNLGLVGVVPGRKRMDLAVDLLERLLQRDPRFMLHIKGPQPQSYDWLWARTAERKYYEALWARLRSSGAANRVLFHPPGDDVAEWFRDIGYVLSPSDFESFHMAVAEGMCSGTLPIPWNWDGAGEIYRLLCPSPDADYAADIVLGHLESTAGKAFAEQSRDYVRAHFDRDVVCDEWHGLLSSGAAPDRAVSTGHQRTGRVLVFWLIGNWETFHRREMIESLARHLEGECEILLVEPGDNARVLIEMGWETEESLQAYGKGRPRRLGENLHALRVVTGELPTKLGRALGVRHVEHRLAGQSLLRIIEARFGADAEVLHWLFKPNQVNRLAEGLDDQFIYEVYDEYTRDFATGRPLPDMLKMELAAAGGARHVFFTSEELMNRKSSLCQRYSLVGNGVNYPVFERYRLARRASPCDGLRGTVGYLGNLSDFFDWVTMLEVATELSDVNFFFHGGIEEERLGSQAAMAESLRALPNTFFTGRVSREQGAAAIARYDALLIPFVQNEAMDAVNPLKLWEYFAVGRPVISSPMKAIAHMSEFVTFAESAQQWIAAISEHLSEPGHSDEFADLVALACEHSWDSLTAEHAKVVRELLAR